MSLVYYFLGHSVHFASGLIKFFVHYVGICIYFDN